MSYIPVEWKSLLAKMHHGDIAGPLLYAGEIGDAQGEKRLFVLTFKAHAGLQLYFDYLSHNTTEFRGNFHGGTWTFGLPVDRQDLWDQPIQIFSGHELASDPMTIVIPCRIGPQDAEIIAKIGSSDLSLTSIHLELRGKPATDQ